MEDISAQLYHAVSKNDPAKVEELLNSGANANEYYYDMENISSSSILHVCCGKGHLESARILVDRGADILSRDKWRMSPLIHAIMPQFTEIVEFLITSNPDVINMCDKYGKAPLHYAIESDSVSILDLLIRHGADVNVGTMKGITPLMLLCSTSDLQNDIEMMRLLIDHGALVNLRDVAAKRTALQYAALKLKIAAVQLLLEVGSDTNTLDGAGRTPMTNVIRQCVRSDGSIQTDDCMSIIVMLLQAGSDLNMTTCEDCCPLMVASLLKCGFLVRFFLEHGADPGIRFASGVYPLLAAVGNRDIPTIKTLLEYNSPLYLQGRVIRRREEFYYNPYELAVHLGCFDIVELLYEYGFNLSKYPYLADPFNTKNIPIPLQQNQTALTSLQELASKPLTLFKIISLNIRTFLGKDLHHKVGMLPLPTSLQRDLICLAG
ncbi:poly [ADP-ribose] polymerase tankyrase-1-like [Saccostrea cucullata]|uniref:poly [ADP-ribose] polymerase tankyrase-1-like n=1 Tax=Saccostrea cuccullata TaxID=36930 RepID=UPI002ED3C521